MLKGMVLTLQAIISCTGSFRSEQQVSDVQPVTAVMLRKRHLQVLHAAAVVQRLSRVSSVRVACQRLSLRLRLCVRLRNSGPPSSEQQMLDHCEHPNMRCAAITQNT